MTDVYKTSKYLNSVNGCDYANRVIGELGNTEEYPLTVDEELSYIGAFRKSLPKDNGAQSPSDESLDEMINSGEHDFFDIDELPLEFLNYESKLFKSKRFSSRLTIFSFI